MRPKKVRKSYIKRLERDMRKARRGPFLFGAGFAVGRGVSSW